jgi:hypothetical protein
MKEQNINKKESPMKRGHVAKTPKVSRKAQAWYDAIAEEWMKKIAAKVAEKQAQQQTSK